MVILNKNYLDLITQYRNEDNELSEDVHVHHIIPRCCGGTDDKNNLVKVSIYHHVMLHKVILSNIQGINAIQREKLMYAYKKMRMEYLELKPKRNKKNRKPETDFDKMIKSELRGLHNRLVVLEDKYKKSVGVDVKLLDEIQTIKKYIRYVNYDKKHHSRKYKHYGKYSIKS